MQESPTRSLRAGMPASSAASPPPSLSPPQALEAASASRTTLISRSCSCTAPRYHASRVGSHAHSLYECTPGVAVVQTQSPPLGHTRREAEAPLWGCASRMGERAVPAHRPRRREARDRSDLSTSNHSPQSSSPVTGWKLSRRRLPLRRRAAASYARAASSSVSNVPR